MNDLLIVYNTCGISGRENSDSYIEALKRIQAQNIGRICISACKNNTLSLLKLKDHFPQIPIVDIKDKLPISVTFNFSVDQMIRKYGEFKGYLYVDSGIFFTKENQIQDLWDLHNSGPYGMTCARTQDDMGFNDWFRTDMVGDRLFENGNLIIPIGKACNLHAQIFSSKIMDFYGHILPDLFAGQCMESIFSFMCAPLKQKWIVSKNVLVHHATGMDVPSCGFSPAEHVMRGGKRWDHMFIRQGSIMETMEKGRQFGMGYEEIQKIMIHDDSKFDTDGFTNIELGEFIRDNLFLNGNEFNYNNIKFKIL